jgi:hypothetical protein
VGRGSEAHPLRGCTNSWISPDWYSFHATQRKTKKSKETVALLAFNSTIEPTFWDFKSKWGVWRVDKIFGYSRISITPRGRYCNKVLILIAVFNGFGQL